MRIIDISTDPFVTQNYADDPEPLYKWIRTIGSRSDYNLSVMGMTPHAGTHIDAPLHYLDNGGDIASVPLDLCYGTCTVVSLSGVLTGEDMDKLLPHCRKRLLIHGGGEASLEISAARVLAESDMILVGIDSMSVSFDDQDTQVHRQLLSRGILILENLNLDDVPDGNYILNAMPLKLGGMEASPVRAVLIAK